MIKKIFLILAAGFIFTGCGNAVKNTLSEQYQVTRPYKIAVLPVIWEHQSTDDVNDVSYLFRVMSADKLRGMNYKVLPLQEIDDRFIKEGRSAFFEKKPEEIARLFEADAVLYTKVIEWDKTSFVTYASLDMEAAFEMYSSSGSLLWTAEYATGESDLRLDSASAEYVVLKAYEPRVQRFIDIVFTTLPAGVAPKEAKQYFQWLP